MQKIVVINTGANLSSVNFALQRIGVNPVITNDITEIESADKVILPGVGNAKYIMEKIIPLKNTLRNLTQPTLGICLGMQILFSHSNEGNVDCLNIIDGIIKPIPTTKPVPHMGWNKLIKCNESELMQGVENEYVYFVHSFYAPVNNYTVNNYAVNNYTIAKVDYSVPISAIVQKNNFYGCQFHPEKSAQIGEKILKNFIYNID